MAISIYIEGQRLDLFDGDNISIESQVKDIEDLTLKADLSQSFSVPASSNNNLIFEHYYDFNIDDGFDARTRRLANIEIDTLDFKQGKISLEKVELKNGKPSSYHVKFTGDAIRFKDLIGKDKLSDLDWLDNFDHDYTDANVQTGLEDGLDFTVDSVSYEKAIIYPLISYTRQYMINTDSSDTTSTSTLVNIDYDAARSDGITYSDLKPAINVPLIFKAIEEKYSLTFSGNFFDRAEYNQLYMNLNNDTDTLNQGYLLVETQSGTYTANSGFYHSTRYRATVTPDAGFENVDYKIILKNNDTIIYESSTWLNGTQTKSGGFDATVAYNLTFEVITEADFDFGSDSSLLHIYLFGSDETDNLDAAQTGLSINLETIIRNLLQDIEVFDFISSIIQMFNLIITPQDDGSLYFNDLQSWYSEGQIYDITPYVDTRKTTVSRGKLYNRLVFKFEESEQILADEYRQQNNIGYGDIDQRLFDASGEPLDGDALEKEVIFENPIFERLTDQNDGSESIIQYCLFTDRELNPYAGKPFLFYAPSLDISSDTLGFVDSTTTYSELNTTVLVPSHSLELDNQSVNVNFGAVYNEYTSEVFTDTLYKTYYDDFISDVFSIKRRGIRVEAILPLNLLRQLKLNDRLIIGDNRYIINKIGSNLTNRKDKLDLINDIYEAPLASDTLNTSVFRSPGGVYSSSAITATANYIGVDDQTISKVDTGDGTGWLTIRNPKTSGVSSEVEFDILANTSGSERKMAIQVTDSVNNPKFYVYQNG